MNEEPLSEFGDFLKESEKITKFHSAYDEWPISRIEELLGDLNKLNDTIKLYEEPKTPDELIESELKRRLLGQVSFLEQCLGDHYEDFNKIIDTYGIPRSDIADLRPWLEEHKDEAILAIERLYKNRESIGYELPLLVDIPSIRRQSEKVSGAHIERYHKIIGEFLQKLTKVGGYMRSISASPTINSRSYFSPLIKNIAISLDAILFSDEDGILHLRDRELIRIYGHEGMGHALNYVVSKGDELPYFLTESSSLTLPTEESVSHFYQSRIFEDLKKDPEIQRRLGIEDCFEEIYREQRDRGFIQDFRNRQGFYAITVLGNKSLGEPEKRDVMDKKAEILKGICLPNDAPYYFLERRRKSFDSRGNLDRSLVSELVYCARPVDRAMREFNNKGINYSRDERDLIDKTFLEGYWTPIGFVDNSRIIAENYTK
jgi:hypothetical protein